jgi:hypothetical protein
MGPGRALLLAATCAALAGGAAAQDGAVAPAVPEDDVFVPPPSVVPDAPPSTLTDLTGAEPVLLVCQTEQAWCVVEADAPPEGPAPCACAGVAGLTVERIR